MIDITIAVPIIIASVEMAKMSGLSKKYAPLFAVVLGVGLFGLFCAGDLTSCLFEGLISGLSASGLYSSAKSFKK